jgi:glucans biosynthesis protein
MNPSKLGLSFFRSDDLRGFGLMQRDRDARSYQDLEARYERRPSVWIEPIGSWGPGSVELVEIPDPKEIHDNIVAFWRPEQPSQAGSAMRFRYRSHWGNQCPFQSPVAQVVATRIGAGSAPGSRKFVLDFETIEPSPGDMDPALTFQVTASKGSVGRPVVQANPEVRGWRVFFEFQPSGEEPAELLGHVSLRDTRMSETWAYRWAP